MTALDVMCYLERLKVQLTLTPEWQLRYRAPRGVMTMVLQGTLKTCKGPLVQLLTTGEDAPLPKGVSLPRDGLPPAFSRGKPVKCLRVRSSWPGPSQSRSTTTFPARRRRRKASRAPRRAVSRRPRSAMGNPRVCTTQRPGSVWRATRG